MASARAWPPRVAAGSSPRAAIAAASGCPPKGKRDLPATGKPPQKLRKRAEFLAVRRGEARRGRLFLLEVLDRGADEPPRFGLTVTKKVGNSVVRNRIRRRLREAVRLHAGDDMAPGNDYVIVGRREVLAAPFGQIRTELSRRIRGTR